MSSAIFRTFIDTFFFSFFLEIIIVLLSYFQQQLLLLPKSKRRGSGSKILIDLLDSLVFHYPSIALEELLRKRDERGASASLAPGMDAFHLPLSFSLHGC